MMNMRLSSVMAPLAASLSVLLAAFGLLMWTVAVMPQPELAERLWLRAAAFFSGVVALVPAISTSLMLRLQRIDAEFVNGHTGGLHPATYIAFCMGRGMLFKLFYLMREIARNLTYPVSLRWGGKVVSATIAVGVTGLLACLAALIVERASA